MQQSGHESGEVESGGLVIVVGVIVVGFGSGSSGWSDDVVASASDSISVSEEGDHFANEEGVVLGNGGSREHGSEELFGEGVWSVDESVEEPESGLLEPLAERIDAELSEDESGWSEFGKSDECLEELELE